MKVFLTEQSELSFFSKKDFVQNSKIEQTTDGGLIIMARLCCYIYPSVMMFQVIMTYIDALT